MRKEYENLEIQDFKEFLDKLRLNNPRTWEQLDFVLKRIVLRWIARKGFEMENALEIYNASLAVFVEKFKYVEFDCFSGMKSYIFSITENKIKEHYRRSKKDKMFEPIDKIKVSEYVEHLSDNEDEKIKSIYHLLNKLTEQEKDILILYYQQEKSFAEIAAILQLKEVNIRVIKHRAIEKLRKWLNRN